MLTGYSCVSFILVSQENKLNVRPIFRMSGLFLVTGLTSRECICECSSRQRLKCSIVTVCRSVRLWRSVRVLHCNELARCHAVILLLFVLNWVNRPETDHTTARPSQHKHKQIMLWRACSLSSTCISARFCIIPASTLVRYLIEVLSHKSDAWRWNDTHSALLSVM